jgi:hypothetical protein
MYKEHMLIEKGHKPAVWMSELDQESNSGAHLNSSSFVKTDGSYTQIEDKTVPGVRDISVSWDAVDSKLGAEDSFNSKADV